MTCMPRVPSRCKRDAVARLPPFPPDVFPSFSPPLAHLSFWFAGGSQVELALIHAQHQNASPPHHIVHCRVFLAFPRSWHCITNVQSAVTAPRPKKKYKALVISWLVGSGMGSCALLRVEPCRGQLITCCLSFDTPQRRHTRL